MIKQSTGQIYKKKEYKKCNKINVGVCSIFFSSDNEMSAFNYLVKCPCSLVSLKNGFTVHMSSLIKSNFGKQYWEVGECQIREEMPWPFNAEH